MTGNLRRGGRAVEGARLESVYTGNCIAGSNPAPSAKSTVRRIDVKVGDIERRSGSSASNGHSRGNPLRVPSNYFAVYRSP
jgi:hypothetical protein